MASEVVPFKISIPESSIKNLEQKLDSSTLPDEVDFADDWSYGAPRGDVARLAAYWRNGFDWRAQEKKLNGIPQFQTKVNIKNFGDINMHFVHKRSTKPGSIPLLFCHGWPGSFLEVVKILPLLTESENGPSFHVVAPSLPNFGFSDGIKKKGFSIPQYAEAVHKVMLNLGYEKYVTQGGDWGFIITRLIGVQYPESCLASHYNHVYVRSEPAFTKTPLLYLKHKLFPYSEDEKAGLARTSWFQEDGFGYNLLQGTKPSTVGFALADSPVALLAWIYEKLHDWTDNYAWKDDEILTWISIYQFSNAGPAASVRIYYESRHAELEKVAQGHTYIGHIPMGLSYFPQDLVVPPKTWGRSLGNVVSESIHNGGGHFASYEKPKELVDDLRLMFGDRGGASQVAKKFV